MPHEQKPDYLSDNSMINENSICLPLKFLPRVNWFAGAVKKTELIISSKEFYRKENHPNRYSLLSANGVIDLSVPLAGGRNQKVNLIDLKIAGGEWKRKHLQAIQSAYGKAPYFLYYFDELENIIQQADENFFALSISLIRWLCSEMLPGVTVKIMEEETAVTPVEVSIEKKYHQVFENKFGFQKNMSAVDLLFCLGPDAKNYLARTEISIE